MKVLILAYDFPPYISVGALRPYSWFKYLNLFDVYPTVVTRQWENRHGANLDYVAPGRSILPEVKELTIGTIIQAPFDPTPANRLLLEYGENKFRNIRKLITIFYELFQFLLPIGGKQKIYQAADEYLMRNKVGCIIATGDPFILFKYAAQLSEKYSIPWIADYRDAWVQDKSVRNKLYKRWCSFFERKFLKNARKITTVSTFIEKQIEQNIANKQFEIIYNGFDPDIINATSGIEQENDFLSIAFTGTINEWHPIESFLRVCNEISSENARIKLELHFYGINKEDKIREIIKGNFQKISQSTRFHPRMENIGLAKSLAKHNVSLLFNDYSFLGTKIFDYLAVKRRILLCYENDPDANRLKRDFYWVGDIGSESSRLQSELIAATNSGVLVRDSRHLKNTIIELHQELRDNGFIDCPSRNIEEYSRINQAKRLAEILQDIE